MKRLAAGLVGLLIVPLAACGSRSHSSTSSAAAPWTATMTVPSHRPRAGRPWPVTIVARTRSGQPLSGAVQYHFLFGGVVVQTRSCHSTGSAPCRFRGTYHDVVTWPRRSTGYGLTFQATVRTRLGTRNLNWWVRVRR